MPSDAFMEMMNIVKGFPSTPDREADGSLTPGPVVMQFSWLAKLRAEAFLETVSIAQLRTEFKKNKPIHTASLSKSLLSGVYNLDINLIGVVYNAVKNGHEADKHPFGCYMKDPLTTLNLNAAYEIATRCIGIVYAPRDSELDINVKLTLDYAGNPDNIVSIADILDGANIVTNNKTIVLLMLPIMNHHRTMDVKMPMDLYRKALEIYTLRCGNYAERIIYAKALSFISNHPALLIAKVDIVKVTDIKFDSVRLLSTFSLAYHRNQILKSAFLSDKLEDLFKNHTRRKESDAKSAAAKVTNPPFYLKMLLGTIDWIWKFRYKWNHVNAAGKDLTLAYTDMFKDDKRKVDVGFNYINNRYILETLGQSFIGFETNSFDSKCNMFRSQARNLISIYDPAKLDWSVRYTTESLAKLYNAVDDYNEGMLDLRRTLFTLDVLIKSDQSFNLYHLLTAYLFYAKFKLKDYALDNVTVSGNIDTQDILQWLEIDV